MMRAVKGEQREPKAEDSPQGCRKPEACDFRRKGQAAPCCGCAERVLYCHQRCERYLAYVTERESIREERKRESDITGMLADNARRRNRARERCKGRYGKADGG